jgi:hypothetical protein
MIIDPSFYSFDHSEAAAKKLTTLNNLRARFVNLKRKISIKMIKGALDYEAINKDVFAWRMATVYPQETPEISDFEDQDENVKDQEYLNKCAIISKNNKLSPEQKWQVEYKLDRIIKDKIDERYSEIVSKKRDLDIRSIQYEDVKSIFYSIVKTPFDDVDFDVQYRQAVKDSLIKTTGFLRTNIYNKSVENKYLIPKLEKKKIKMEEEDKVVSQNIFTRIERVDPETVFVDVLEGDVNEMFIITPYTQAQLKARFGIEDKYFSYDANSMKQTKQDNSQDQKAVIIPEGIFNYHLGERLASIYKQGDMRLDEFLCPQSSDGKYDYSSDKLVQTSSVYLLANNAVNNHYESYLYNTLGINPTHMLTEYFNKDLDIYVIYCSNMIIYQGRFMDIYNDFPVQPLYTTRMGNNYFGELFSENLSHEQDRYNQLLHQQELSSIMLDKPNLIISSESLDEDYHPFKNINLIRNSPYNEFHVKKDSVVNGVAGNPIQQIQMSNITNDILEGRKNGILATIERRFPTLKSLAASNSAEVQREIIYSRDMGTNEMMEQIGICLSCLAPIVFNARLFEYRIKQLFDTEIRAIDGSMTGQNINIQKNDEDRQKKAKEVAQKLDKEYTQKVQEMAQKQLTQPDEEFQALKEQISAQLQEALMSSAMTQLETVHQTDNQDPENPNQALSPEAIASIAQDHPEIQEGIAQELQRQLPIALKQEFEKKIIAANPPPKDGTLYLVTDQIKLIRNNVAGIKFLFDKSLKEKIRNYTDMLAMIKPFEAQAKFLFNPKNFLKEIVLSCGFNPDTMLVERPPSIGGMLKWDAMKVNTFYNWETNPDSESDFLNDLYMGSKQYTPQQLLKSHMERFSLEQMAIEKAKQSTLEMKTTSQMAIDGNKGAVTGEVAQKQAMTQAKAPVVGAAPTINPN